MLFQIIKTKIGDALKLKPKNYSAGFTLLEMIVSLGIFAIVAVIAVGSLVRITGLNRQAQYLQSAMNNINYVLESISREMRFGNVYYCGNVDEISASATGLNITRQDCPSGAKVIAFKSSKTGTDSGNTNSCQLAIAYWFGPGAIRKGQQVRCDDLLSSTTASMMIDPNNVTLTGYELNVYTDVPTHLYAWATISVTGYAGVKANEKNEFSIRTGISQRLAD